LIEYGSLENKIHQKNLVTWSFDGNIEENLYQQGNLCRFTILEIREIQIGSDPHDMHIELEDLYVSEGLLGPFWMWVEGNASPNDFEFRR
jgi:hypothetical protein